MMLARRWLPGAAVMLVLGGAGALQAQRRAERSYPAGAWKGGPLVVWMVSPATAQEHARVAARKAAVGLVGLTNPAVLQQQTSGSFGQTAGSYGQTAGSTGTTAGSYGQTASSTGQTSGSYGTPASNVGTASSNVGTTAGSYGQAAGSFGQPSSEYAVSPGTGGGGRALRTVVGDWAIDDLRGQFHAGDSNGAVRFVDVPAEELKDKLTGLAPEDYPDVVVARTLPEWWAESGVGLNMLGWPFAMRGLQLNSAQLREAALRQPDRDALQIVVMARAKHPRAARAFVMWVRDEGICGKCEETWASWPRSPRSPMEEPVTLARGALLRVLGGGSLGTDADAEAAPFSGELARGLALGTAEGLATVDALQDLHVQIDVLDAAASERLAVVLLRAVAEPADGFGVTHALVVLRKDAAAGRWRVLQVSPNVAPGELREARDEFEAAWSRHTGEKVAGISQASPPDGDNRQRQPDLWWDNGGGAGLLAVEWQMNLGGKWTDTRLMLVPDRDPRTQTRVPAVFAQGGEYRWRVWAVGAGGETVISAWRKLKIVP